MPRANRYFMPGYVKLIWTPIFKNICIEKNHLNSELIKITIDYFINNKNRRYRQENMNFEQRYPSTFS